MNENNIIEKMYDYENMIGSKPFHYFFKDIKNGLVLKK